MTASARLIAFAAALAVVLGASFGAARALDVDLADGESAATRAPTTQPAHSGGGHSDVGHGAGAGHSDTGHGAGSSAGSVTAAGLAASDGTYVLDRQWAAPRAGQEAALSFRIRTGDGTPETRFDVEHDKRMHLIVVRRDLAHFQHLHPDLAPDGTWSQRLVLPAPGTYRMFTDFTVDGEKHTLGADLSVAGDFAPVPLPEPAARTAVDGYTVELAGDPHAGQDAVLDFRVSRDGAPVDDLEPYLGARGHLVALREGDLGYLHVHPTGDDSGNRIRFATTFPAAGTYRLFLQFRSGDVHTAELTLEVPA